MLVLVGGGHRLFMPFNGYLYAKSSFNKNRLDVDQTKQRRRKVLVLSVAGSLVIKEMLVAAVTLSSRLVVRVWQKGKIYWPSSIARSSLLQGH